MEFRQSEVGELWAPRAMEGGTSQACIRELESTADMSYRSEGSWEGEKVALSRWAESKGAARHWERGALSKILAQGEEHLAQGSTSSASGQDTEPKGGRQGTY